MGTCVLVSRVCRDVYADCVFDVLFLQQRRGDARFSIVHAQVVPRRAVRRPLAHHRFEYNRHRAAVGGGRDHTRGHRGARHLLCQAAADEKRSSRPQQRADRQPRCHHRRFVFAAVYNRWHQARLYVRAVVSYRVQRADCRVDGVAETGRNEPDAD